MVVRAYNSSTWGLGGRIVEFKTTMSYIVSSRPAWAAFIKTWAVFSETEAATEVAALFPDSLLLPQTMLVLE